MDAVAEIRRGETDAHLRLRDCLKTLRPSIIVGQALPLAAEGRRCARPTIFELVRFFRQSLKEIAKRCPSFRHAAGKRLSSARK